MLCCWVSADPCHRLLQAGPAGASGTTLRRRRTGAAPAGCDVIAEVCLHWAGGDATDGGVARSGVSGPTGPGR